MYNYPEEVVQLIENGQKQKAINALMELKGLSLGMAKQLVEQYQPSMNQNPQSGAYFTLDIIRDRMIAYTNALKAIDVPTNNEFKVAHQEAKEEFVSSLNKFRGENPELWLTGFSKKLSKSASQTIVEQIVKNVSEKYEIGIIPNYSIYLEDKIQGDTFFTPSYINGESFELNIHPDDKKTLTDYLLSLLLSLPIKKIHFTIVDLQNTFALDYFYGRLAPSLYGGKPINQEYALGQYIDQMNTRVLNCVQKYGDLTEYNRKHQNIIMPYEIILVLGEVDRTNAPKMNSLINNGKKGGVFVHRITFDDKCSITSNKGICHIQDNPCLEEAILNYINSTANAKEGKKVISLDISTAESSDYTPIQDGILLPVGQVNNDEKIFRMDLVSHVHAFVLGQSGSGKSVFLHNVISGAMLKYAPEDLELYLLDFKLGGVEFNRYKGEKHVRAMLVDNSDQQITLEILRELRERMTERGKLLRQEGVTNIAEYNAKASEKMPHILFVADECHELFRVGTDVPRTISIEISEIITKIAKEGRSQGVHLLMATQTLSGTEINNEILNNISDHYLLKCSVADSERLVMNSSDKTSTLSTGQIYYHHVDGEEIFQAFYTDKHAAEKIVNAINKKAAQHRDNGVFYFSGASLFKLDESVIAANAKKCRRNAVVLLGKSINLAQADVCVSLREDYSENVLMVGLNDQDQVTRVMMNALWSSLLANAQRGNDIAFKVVDCLNSDESIYKDQLEELENAGKIDIIQPRKRGEFFKTLTNDIQNNRAKETMLFILGQDKFRELKLDMDLPADNTEQSTNNSDLTSMLSMGAFGSSPTSSSAKTYRGALDIILDKGPEQGVHTILQVEKPSNILYMDYLSPKILFQKFKHVVALKSDERAGSQLGLRDDIRLELLNRDEERMRAFYYSEESDEYTLFTPYMPIEEKEIKNLIKNI